MAPFITEEQWHRLGHEGSIHVALWPVFDAGLAAEDEVTMVVQVNGKVRDTIAVPSEVTEDQMVELALASPNVQSFLGERPPAKVIARPPKIVSLVAARN